ncbi:MAG: 4-hydroxy-3-methylbut-2-enyl diphosphate reductase [Ignavibacteriaceae bacterium]
MRKFDIPAYYRSNFITRIKENRKESDPRKKDFSPTRLDFGSVRFLIPRHFGFCYGVENAIEVSYKIIEENPGRRIFLLSEMIHNPDVNSDLISRGIKFIMDTSGNQLIDWNEIRKDDIVIIPAFGTTLETESILKAKGIDTVKYNTTCPFVEKVWNRSAQIGQKGFTIVIHGKHYHEETRATFSHSNKKAPSVIVRDLEETRLLGDFISGSRKPEEFYRLFEGRYSDGFDPEKDLKKVGVVNQTTMLASETQDIADYLRYIMTETFGKENIKEHFADTRDTLCYATYDNQEATYGLLNEEADIAIVVGGYNSSNTGHIAELCSRKLPTYLISGADKLISDRKILHFDLSTRKEISTENYLPVGKVPDIILTSGASCPDAVVDQVLDRLLEFLHPEISKQQLLTSVEEGR